MPEQNAFPAPVKIRMPAVEFLTSSSACDQIVDEFIADGVALVGTIERERRNAGIEGELEVL